MYVYHNYFGDDPWFCNTFGLKAEMYVTRGAPGTNQQLVFLLGFGFLFVL